MRKYYNLYNQLDEIVEIVKKFIDILPELPDNPNIKRIDDTCFTIGIKTINLDPRHSLSPFYYDYRSQYRFILDRLANASIHRFADMFLNIINKKSYYYGGCSYHFHPEVITNIVNAIPELAKLKGEKHGSHIILKTGEKNDEM